MINRDDMTTVSLVVNVKINARQWQEFRGKNPGLNPGDVARFVERVLSARFADDLLAPNEVTATPNRRTLMVLEGRDAKDLAKAIARRHGNGTLHTIRFEDRAPNGLAWKIDEGGWSPTVGCTVRAE